jgi:hypothetical protein
MGSMNVYFLIMLPDPDRHTVVIIGHAVVLQVNCDYSL